MKSFVAIAAFGLFAAAQAQDSCAALAAKIPSCATSCIASAASGVGCSSPSDLACQCKNTAAINAAALNCVLSGCGAQTGLAVQASASAVCACESTAAAAPASSAAAAPTSAAASSPTTSGAASVAAVSASPAASAASSPSSGVTQISDGQIQATGAASPSTGMMSNSTVPFTGSGAKIVVSVGGALAAFAVAVVAL